MSTTKDIRETTLEELTERAQGQGSAEELVDELVEEGVELLHSSGIDADKPLETSYESTDSFEDAFMNGWAGKMNPYSSELKIRGREVGKTLNDLLNSLEKSLPEEDTETENGREENELLEKNAFYTAVHEVFHFDQAQEFVGETGENSAKENYEKFKNTFSAKMRDGQEIGFYTPETFLDRVIDDRFEYSFGALLPRLNVEQKASVADKISEHYNSWREACGRTEDLTEDLNDEPRWLESGDDSILGTFDSDANRYINAVLNIEKVQDEEALEEYTDELEEIIEDNADNYDEDEISHVKSPQQAKEEVEELRENKEVILENNQEQHRQEEMAEDYILEVLDNSTLGEPVTKPFKEAFAQMTTLALRGDLNDPEAREEYLERVEESYNSDTCFGYDEDAGTALRNIIDTVIEDQGEIKGDLEQQIGTIHDIQSQYASEHRIPYKNNEEAVS